MTAKLTLRIPIGTFFGLRRRLVVLIVFDLYEGQSSS